MIKWIKKKILKSIIKDIIKELPTFKEESLKLLEIYTNELLEKCKEKLRNAIEEFIKDKFNKTV